VTPLAGEPGALAVAAAGAAASVWSWTGPSGPATRLRGLAGGGTVGGVPLTGHTAETVGRQPLAAPGHQRWAASWPAPRALAVLVVVGAAVGVVVTGAGTVAGTALAVLMASVARHRRDVRGRRERDDALAEQAVLCEALAAELRAGRPPARALRAAAGEGCGPGATALRRAAGVADLGGDVAGALGLRAALPPGPARLPLPTGVAPAGAPGRDPRERHRAPAAERSPGPDALVRLAACWRVAETSGAALAPVVDRLAEGLRAQERQRAELAGELTGARTTGRMLAVLPVLGVLLAAAVGARPVEFLLGTPLGGACLLGALALDLAGLAWTGRLATRALASAR
jgi:tight adherence protein B